MAPRESVFNRFSGLAQGILRWAGARRSGNAASIPPNMFRDLENVRFEGQDIICRGGQTKYNIDDVLEGCIDGFVPPDYEPPNYELFFICCEADSALALDGTNCGITVVEDHGATATIGGFADVASVTQVLGSGAGGSGGYVFVGSGDTDGHDLSWATYQVDENFDLVTASPSPITVSGAGISGEGACGGVAKFDGEYFAVFSRTLGSNGESIVWNGTTDMAEETQTDTSAEHGYSPLWLLVDASNELACPLHPAQIHYRDDMGVWNTAGMPAGTVANRNHVSSGASTDPAGGNIYFSGTAVGGGMAIFSFESGTATQQFQAGGVPPTYQPVCFHNGTLWFLTNSAGTSIGKKTPAGVFTADVFTFTGSDPIVQFASVNGLFYALRTNSIWVSEFPDRFWEQVDDTTAAYVHAIVIPVV